MDSEPETPTDVQGEMLLGNYADLSPGPDPTPSQCKCSVCRQTFGSITGFDRHRTGPVDHRRCQHPHDVGMIPSSEKRGIVWRLPDTRNHDTPSAGPVAPQTDEHG